MKRSRVTVLMLDKNQVLNSEQHLGNDYMQRIKELTIKQKNYMKLEKQLRICADKETLDWINNITDRKEIGELHKDSLGYEIVPYKTPQEMYEAIKEKSKNEDTKLSRIVATYDWEYSDDKKQYYVEIGDFRKLWNYQIEAKDNNLDNKSWSEKPQTIDEVGSIFTIQGFDLSYVGVIIGDSVTYEDGKLVFHPEKNKQKKVNQRVKIKNGYENCGIEYVKNQLHVLLTRGINGLYIYACDDALRNKLLEVYENKQSRG